MPCQLDRVLALGCRSDGWPSSPSSRSRDAAPWRSRAWARSALSHPATSQRVSAAHLMPVTPPPRLVVVSTAPVAHGDRSGSEDPRRPTVPSRSSWLLKPPGRLLWLPFLSPQFSPAPSELERAHTTPAPISAIAELGAPVADGAPVAPSPRLFLLLLPLTSVVLNPHPILGFLYRGTGIGVLELAAASAPFLLRCR